MTGPIKPDLTAQTPADKVTYSGWTPPNGISHSTGCPPRIVGSWRSGIPEAATALTPATKGPGLARPTVTVEDLLRANGMEVVPAAELAALRADGERLEWLVANGCSVQWNLFAQRYYVLPFKPLTHISEGLTWREAIDAARGAA